MGIVKVVLVILFGGGVFFSIALSIAAYLICADQSKEANKSPSRWWLFTPTSELGIDDKDRSVIVAARAAYLIGMASGLALWLISP